jgi:hypothetical protein
MNFQFPFLKREPEPEPLSDWYVDGTGWHSRTEQAAEARRVATLEARLAEAQRDRDAEVKHGDMSGFRRGLPNLGDAANLPRPPDGD